MNQLDRVTIASRAFCFAVVLGLSATTGSLPAMQSALLLGVIAATSAAVAMRAGLNDHWVAVGEALLVGLLIGATLPVSVVLLPYLAIPGLIAGIARGVRSLTWVLAAEAVGLLLISLLSLDPDRLQYWNVVAPWLGACLGVGLLGSLLRQMGKVPDASSDPSYESARRLVTQLRTVARQLSAGLDPVSMSSQMLNTVGKHLGDGLAVVFIRTEGGLLAPLAYRGANAESTLLAEDPVVDACWAEMEPAHASSLGSPPKQGLSRSAFPLRVGSRMLGVVMTDSPATEDTEAYRALMRDLDEHSLRLDTALAFDEVRALATVEERRRLAREIHDGIAQEVASLGYLVDDLVANADSGEQAAQLKELRSELTRVVSELRLSIFDLRSEVNPSIGLGSALSDYVRQVGSRSKLTVHLTLDEAPTRLRSEVETELLRIAQEAVTNARKHSSAQNLWVDCRVQPPFARIEVGDDGMGLSQGREDSFGMRIMRERAKRIGATLVVQDRRHEGARAGTLIRVVVGTELSQVNLSTSTGEEDPCHTPTLHLR